ncbi:MAG TPA: sulfotransferase [Candidatus Binataceae bacterium]|nr:sulfotransferase [Candidatus Binataceae bacterium]
MDTPIGRLPDFIAIGPPRTGTTWLHRVLKDHVGLQRGPAKETNFFWRRGYERGLDWYVDQFRHCQPDRPIVEVSPNYFGSTESFERIVRHMQHCRFICTLREPIERSYSYYKLMRHDGRTRQPFSEYVAIPEVADANRYGFRLRQWRKQFGGSNILVMLYDDLAAASESFLNPICDFMGIAPIPIADSPLARKKVHHVSTDARSALLARNAMELRYWLSRNGLNRTVKVLRKLGVWRFCLRGGPEFPPLEPDLARRLRERLRPEIDDLEELIGRDLSAWKQPQGGTKAAAMPGRVQLSNES